MRLIKSMIPAIILLAAAACLQINIAGIFVKIPARIEISAADYDIAFEESVKPEQLKLLRGIDYSFVKETEAFAYGANSYVSVNVMITDGNYSLFSDFMPGSACFFTSQASDIGLNLAVISKNLSYDIFGTYNSIGNKLFLNGLVYTVSGVFAQNALYGLLSSNGNECVYIPSNSDFDKTYASQTAVQRIFIMTDKDTSSPFITDTILTELMKVSPNTSNYQVNDFSKADRIIKQYFSAFKFIAGLSAIILLMRFIWLSIIKIKRNTGQSADANKAANNPAEIRNIILSALLLAAACVFFVKTCLFSLYIPPNYIPNDSFFNFGFYRQLIFDGIQKANALFAYKKSAYEIFYGFANKVNIICIFAELALTAFLYIKVYKRINNRFASPSMDKTL